MTTLAKLLGAGGANPEQWAASLVVPQGDLVLSPLDWEVYRRIAATGASATDPANDTTNYISASFERCAGLADRAGGVRGIGGTAGLANYGNGVTRTIPGNIAAGVRTQLLGLTGRGVLSFLGLYANNTRTSRIEVLVDGRTVLDTNVVFTAAAQTCTLLGSSGANGSWPEFYAMPDAAGANFRRSCQVYVTVTGNPWSSADSVSSAFRSIA